MAVCSCVKCHCQGGKCCFLLMSTCYLRFYFFWALFWYFHVCFWFVFFFFQSDLQSYLLDFFILIGKFFFKKKINTLFWNFYILIMLSNDGGGGERVLWKIIQSFQQLQTEKDISLYVYSGDLVSIHDTHQRKQLILDKVMVCWNRWYHSWYSFFVQCDFSSLISFIIKERFNIHLVRDRINFIFLSKRRWVEASRYKTILLFSFWMQFF